MVFDELIGYRGWENHEFKAFMEFIDETGFDYAYVAYGLTYVIVRLSAGDANVGRGERFAEGNVDDVATGLPG